MSERQDNPTATSSRTATPRRWLVAQASAVLASVAAQNYTCYGGSGVPHYGPAQADEPPDEPGTITLTVMLLDAQQQARLRWPDLRLRVLEQNERRTVWSGYDRERHLQALWVWDFYRIQSHFALRAALPEGDGEVAAARRATLEALRALQPGDVIAVEVQSACGDIQQTHTVERPAAEWKPG
ncbi:MAG: hypothetical protein GX573_02155 [Chloroflexi bacterium]|nr:hypothetical protein [Chloroflexota bacterium]